MHRGTEDSCMLRSGILTLLRAEVYSETLKSKKNIENCSGSVLQVSKSDCRYLLFKYCKIKKIASC